MTKGEIAKKYFESGYNCAQSVVLAFKDEMGLDEKTAVRIIAGFGGGFGRLREVCGAVSGMTAVISFFKADDNPDNHEAKKALYALIQKAIGEFKEENGSYICKNLLGLSDKSDPIPEVRNSEYYKKRPCSELCQIAADIAADYIK